MAKAPIRKPRKKVCLFCQEKIAYVDYKDTPLLRKFISDRGKIRARRVTGNGTQHRRDAATAIKNARGMALLPYRGTPRWGEGELWMARPPREAIRPPRGTGLARP